MSEPRVRRATAEERARLGTRKRPVKQFLTRYPTVPGPPAGFDPGATAEPGPVERKTDQYGRRYSR